MYVQNNKFRVRIKNKVSALYYIFVQRHTLPILQKEALSLTLNSKNLKK